MTNNKANKSKMLALILGLTMCISLMLGIAMASPTFAAYAAGEDGTAPTIVKTGGNDVDRKNHMGKLPNALKGVEYKAKDGSNYKIEATGTEPFTFHANKWGEGGYSPLPEGLSLNPTTGEIEGTPKSASQYRISVTVTNKYGSDNIYVGMYVYDETSKPKITTTQADIAVGYENSSYSQRIVYNSGTGEPSEASIIGNLPTGLRLRQAGFGIFIEGKIQNFLLQKMDFTEHYVDRDIISQFVDTVIPRSETCYEWYMDFDLIEKPNEKKKNGLVI